MKKLLKWVGILAGVAAVLLVAAFFTLKAIFPEEKIKSIIQTYAQNTLKREITFSDLSFNLIGITLKDLAISESTTFEQGTFIRADNVVVKLKLKPLLKKQINISTVGLKGLQINLIKDKEGKFNFEDLTQSSTTEPQEDTSSGSDSSTQFFDLLAEHVYTRNCAVFYKDQQENLQVSVTNLNVDVKDFDLTSPFDARLQFNLGYQDERQNISLPIKSNLTINLSNLDLAQAYVTLQNLDTNYREITLALKGGVKNFNQPTVNLQGLISGVSNTALAELAPDLPHFVLPNISFEADGVADLDNSLFTLSQAKLAVSDSSILAVGKVGWGGDTPSYNIQNDINLNLTQLASMTNLLDGFGMKGKITGQLTATDKKDKQDVHGTITLDKVAVQYPPVTVSEMSGNITLASLAEITSPKITGNLNQEPFSLSFTYKDLGSVLDILFQANLSKLKLDTFSTSSGSDTEQNVSDTPVETAPSSQSATAETLFNLKGTLTVGEIAVPYFSSTGASLNVSLTKASASLKQANGTISFDLQEGTINDLMTFVKDNKIVKILLLPLTLVKKVTSKLGINLFQPSENSGQIKFSSGSGTYQFNNGLMNIEETHFNSAISNMTATGNINFKTDALDMRVKATVLTSQTPIVIKIGGTTSNPSGKLDITKTAVSLVGGIVNYKTPGKVASSTVHTAKDAGKTVVNTGSQAVSSTVNTAVNTVKNISGLFKKDKEKNQ
ncbi:MAG: AsmA family protein [Elusimicrobiaceae bacterium]|nr:AsmA family protein [Elusimicrobiaceae bacterium]